MAINKSEFEAYYLQAPFPEPLEQELEGEVFNAMAFMNNKSRKIIERYIDYLKRKILKLQNK